jgi:hypothetical protein
MEMDMEGRKGKEDKECETEDDGKSGSLAWFVSLELAISVFVGFGGRGCSRGSRRRGGRRGF